MEKLNKKIIAEGVYKRWQHQYGNWQQDDKQEILKKLKGVTDPDEIDKIIGNDGWTEVPKCSECKKAVDVIMAVGEDCDYESESCYLCVYCIVQALDKIREV